MKKPQARTVLGMRKQHNLTWVDEQWLYEPTMPDRLKLALVILSTKLYYEDGNPVARVEKPTLEDAPMLIAAPMGITIDDAIDIVEDLEGRRLIGTYNVVVDAIHCDDCGAYIRTQSSDQHDVENNEAQTWQPPELCMVCYGIRADARAEQKKETQRRRSRVRLTRERAAGPDITEQEWADLKRKYDNTCLGCGKTEPAVSLVADHVIPLARGGVNALSNRQPLCGSCNSHKSDKTIDYRPQTQPQSN